MKTKRLNRIRALALCTLLALLFAALMGCASEKTPGKHQVVKNFGYVDSNDVKVCELAGHEDRIAELAHMALLIRDVKPDYGKSINEDGRLRLFYTAVVEEIYMDLPGNLKAGDEIGFLSYNGYCPIPTAKKLLGEARFADGKQYGEQDEIVTYIEGALPIEENGTYLIYLTVREDGSLAENGKNFLYQICGDSVYAGCERTKSEYSLKELKEHVRTVAKNRTGIADEIGAAEYLKKCGVEDFENHPPVE